MAWSYGGYGPHHRTAFEYYVSHTATTTTISINLRIQMYGQRASSGTWQQNWSGQWGSGSASPYYNIGAGGSVVVKYWSGTVARQFGRDTSVSFAATTRTFDSASSHSFSVVVPARAYLSPRPPLNPSAVRNSDTKATVSWNTNYDGGTGAQPWTGVYVDRYSYKTKAWTRVATVGWSTTSWTDSGISVNDRYSYRVTSYNNTGNSTAAQTGEFSTTPSAPAGVSAEKTSSLDIVVSWTNTATHIDGADVYDGTTLLGSVSGLAQEFTHTSPSTSATHQYFIQTKSGGLLSVKSTGSNIVQLEAAPNPPTNVQFTQAIYDNAEQVNDIVLSWKHNPVDSSTQRRRAIRIRKVGETAWKSLPTLNSSAQETDKGLIGIFVGTNWGMALASYEAQIQTWGAHADPSNWSASARFAVESQPGVTIISPVPGEVIGISRVDLSWTYSDTNSPRRPQQRYDIKLSAGGSEVWSVSTASTATSVSIPYTLQDGLTYSLTLVVTASNGLKSNVNTVVFEVDYLEPGTPTVGLKFHQDDGSTTVSILNPPTPLQTMLNRVYRSIEQSSRWQDVGDNPVLPEPIVNHFVNPRFVGDGTWVELRKNLAIDPGFTSLRKKLGTSADNMHTGSGTQISTDSTWSVVGGSSLKISGSGRSSAAYLNWTAANQGMSLDVWGGKRYTVAATVFRGAVAGDLVHSTNAPPRAIAVGVDVGGVRTWVHARSELAPDTIGETRLVVSFDLPTGSSSDFWFIRLFNGSAAQPVWWDALTVEEGVTDGSFFGWDRIPHEGMRVRALGTAPFAQSILEGERVRGVGQGSRVLAIRGEVEGKPAIRMVATEHGVNTHRFAYISVPTDLRGGGVAMATRHQSAQFSAPTSNMRTLMVASPDQEIAFENEAGVFPLRVDYSALTGTYSMYLYHGGMPGDPDVLYTDIGLFELGCEGSAFGGPASGYLDNGIYYTDTFTGAEDASPTVRNFSLPPVEEAEWEYLGEFPENATFDDYEGLTNGKTMYRVEAVSEIPSSAVGLGIVQANSKHIYLGAGVSFATQGSIPYDLEISDSGDQADASMYIFDGHEKPTLITGIGTEQILQISGSLDPTGELGVGYHELIRLAKLPGVKIYRDLDGRRLYVKLSDVKVKYPKAGRVRDVSFKVQEVNR